MSSHSLPSTRRLAYRLLPILPLLLAAPALRADSITYNVKLSPVQGVYGGTGSITVSVPPSRSGITTYSTKNQNLQGLNFTIDGQTFSLAQDHGASVQFLDGKLYNISFAETIGNYPNRFTLDTYGGYAFYYNQFDTGFSESYGAITADLAPTPDTAAKPASTATPSPTPEPGTFIFLATALLTGGLFLLRRKMTVEP